MVMDMCVSVICSLFAVLIVRWFSDPFGSLKQFVALWTLASVAASAAGFLLLKTYRVVIFHSSYQSISKQMLATCIKELLLLGLVLSRTVIRGYIHIQFLVLLIDFPLTLCSLVMVRVIIIAIYQSMKNSPENNIDKMATLICGTSVKSISLVTRMSESPHYNVKGYLTVNRDAQNKILGDKQVFFVRSLEDFRALQVKMGIECLMVPSDIEQSDEYITYKNFCSQTGTHLFIAPTTDEVQVQAPNKNRPSYVTPQLSPAGSIYPQPDYVIDGMSSPERVLKRIVDCIAAAILLIVFSPLFLICFLAIKISDGGPAIYSQERIGRFGRPFKIYKFRSMRTDAEKMGPALYSGDDDPRLTKVGAFLRKHHLDELPQLWNVFVGDMAFVGPRPERKYYIDQIMAVDPRYYFLYQIRPGVTSYATFFNGYTDTLEKMIRRLDYDIYYLRNRSWWFDFKILGMTFMSIVFGKKF